MGTRLMTMVAMLIRMPREMRAEMQREAKRRDMSASRFVRELWREYKRRKDI